MACFVHLLYSFPKQITLLHPCVDMSALVPPFQNHISLYPPPLPVLSLIPVVPHIPISQCSMAQVD